VPAAEDVPTVSAVGGQEPVELQRHDVLSSSSAAFVCNFY
jgi:hypothetical protein